MDTLGCPGMMLSICFYPIKLWVLTTRDPLTRPFRLRNQISWLRAASLKWASRMTWWMCLLRSAMALPSTLTSSWIRDNLQSCSCSPTKNKDSAPLRATKETGRIRKKTHSRYSSNNFNSSNHRIKQTWNVILMLRLIKSIQLTSSLEKTLCGRASEQTKPLTREPNPTDLSQPILTQAWASMSQMTSW